MVAGVDDVHGALTNLSLCKSKVRVRAHTHTHTHTHTCGAGSRATRHHALQPAPHSDTSRNATAQPSTTLARSPVFYGRSRISAPVSRLPEGSRPGDRISRRLFDECDSNLHHAPWCDEHKSFMQRTTLLRSAYFAEIARFFGPRYLII